MNRLLRLVTCRNGLAVFVFLLALAMCVGPLFAQNDAIRGDAGYNITRKMLSVEHGLASHEVFCGVQDSAGFIWFGTRNGLNRYDGRKCLLFTRQRNKLQDNKVVQLALDDANKLFIQYGSSGFQLTTNGKIDVMDATTREVRSLTETFPNLPFKERDVYWVANDGTDEVCFLTASPFRFWRYSSKNGFRLRLEMKDWTGQDSLIDYRTTGPFSSFLDGIAHLKFSNQQRQYVLNGKTTMTFQQTDALRSLPIGFSKQKELLITYNEAQNPDAFVVDKLMGDGKLVRIHELQPHHLEHVAGRYWYQVRPGTDGKHAAFYIPGSGLFLWNQDAFLKVIDKTDLKGFENLFVYQVFPDRIGNLWICTSLGVMQLTVRKSRFVPYFSNAQQGIEANSQVRGIYAEQAGGVYANVWLHTFRQQRGTTQAVKNEYINYALLKHRGQLYSGGYNVFRYDEKGNRMTGVTDQMGTEIWSMHALNDSLILLGRTNGFALFNTRTNQVDSIPETTRPEARFIYRFFRGHDGVLRAVTENGLYELKQSSTHPGWTAAKMRSGFLDGLSLLDAWQEPGGTFWLATNGEGLYRWDPKKNDFQQFNITAGFPSDVLYRIESDAFGNLWISSDYGLIRFNRQSRSVNTYTSHDGLTHNEFNRTSSFKSGDGRLFFGGLNGVNGFNPADFRTDKASLRVPLQVVSFNQFVGAGNELVDRTIGLLRSRAIVLQPEDKFFTLDFQLLDFAENEGHRYGYRIEGVDKSWNYINENSVRISGLPYGDYVLRIRAQNREGAWNQMELGIPVKVLKPLYWQWWFILLEVLAAVLGIYLLIRWRLNRLAREKARLEETVSERTLQLKQAVSEQSALLQEKDVLMREIHHRVKNNLQVISGLLELQGKTLTDEKAREALQEGRNRVRSIALIHQNLYQFENLSTIDLHRFVTDLCRQVQSVFAQKKPVTMNINVPELHLDIDSAVPLGLILNELLTNSFKYAMPSVEHLNVQLMIRALEEGRFELICKDNGQGLPDGADLRKSGSLGLQLVNDLSRQIGGNVYYATDGGASFTVAFTNREVRKNID